MDVSATHEHNRVGHSLAGITLLVELSNSPCKQARRFLQKNFPCPGCSDFTLPGYSTREYFSLYRGWKIALSNLPAMQNPSKIKLSSFFTRMVRWTRLRITMMPVIGVLEPLTECLAIGILGCWGAYHLWIFNVWKLLLFHCLFWFVADQLLLHTMQGPVPMPPYHELILAWLLRETWTYFIFLRGLCGREITWKKGAFRIQTGGKAYRIQGMKVEDDEHCL